MRNLKPAPGYTVTDFTGVDPKVVDLIKDLLPDDMTTDALSAELIKRFSEGRIEPPLTSLQAHPFALELKLRARCHRDRVEKTQ